MKTLLWKLLERLDNNHGYSTPLQKRFKVGDHCRISSYKLSGRHDVGQLVQILETGRHDYLILNLYNHQKSIVYQFELTSDTYQ